MEELYSKHVDVVYETILGQLEKSSTSHLRPPNKREAWFSVDVLGSRRRQSLEKSLSKKRQKVVYASIVIDEITTADSAWLDLGLTMTMIWRSSTLWEENAECSAFEDLILCSLEEDERYYRLTSDQMNYIEKPVVRMSAVEKRKDEMRYYPESGLFVYTANLKVTKKKSFALATFPFDTQSLELDFVLETEEDELCLHQISYTNAVLDFAGSEFTLSAPEKIRRGPRHTAIRLKASRNFRYYILNAFAPLSLISALLPMIFFVAETPVNRLHLATSLLIATITFKYTLTVLRLRAPPNCAQSDFFDTFFFRVLLLLFIGTGLLVIASLDVCYLDPIAFVLSLLLYPLLLGSWLFSVQKHFLNSTMNCAWRKQPDEARYAFRFEFPAFLPPPQSYSPQCKSPPAATERKHHHEDAFTIVQRPTTKLTSTPTPWWRPDSQSKRRLDFKRPSSSLLISTFFSSASSSTR